MSSKHTYSEWRKHSAGVRTKYGISSSFAGWTSRPDGQNVPPVHRSRDIANCGWATKVKSAPPGTAAQTLKQDFWCDFSPTIQREPWFELNGSLTTKSMRYSYAHDCLLSGRDHLLLQGLPKGQAPRSEFTDAAARNLAGEAFSLPCMATATAAFWLNPWAPWWKP